MVRSGENDLKLHKALAQMFIDGLKKPNVSLEKELLKQLERLNFIKMKIAECDTFDKINEYSKEYEEFKGVFVKNLAIKSMIDSLIQKNQERVDYIDNKLKKQGVYIIKPEKKEMKIMLDKIKKSEMSSDEIFTNVEINDSFVLLVEGIMFFIKRNKIDFSDNFNDELLKKQTDFAISKALKINPESISTIKIEQLIDVSIKQKLLKHLSFFIADKQGTLSFEKINNLLGKPLNFNLKTPSSIREFVSELQNMYNVKIVSWLKENNPELEEDINNYLSVNEDSEYL